MATMTITEVQDAAEGLQAWFESQGLSDGQAAVVMSYLLGASAAGACDFTEALSRLRLSHAASVAVALSACELMEAKSKS